VKEILGWKIRRKSDGAYLSGSSWSPWSPRGTVWSSIGRATASINRHEFSEHEILDLEIVEVGELRSYSIAHELDRLKLKNK